ncbi:hypothetical protein [Candidatus Uabimicrobium amorphum]|uniref:Uncharacterized protein n=1 Tax=Uabimicrobium amorphum TaxID=2596890 RepID=A0A5S9IT04_UABAM|nr:hypothetical protein [Candidatus Uabimicrobium amorphum]BBM86872.1 hypothetical protein UABAM_05274 [Candidatus Uabimicrobium amorphum]
MVLDGKKFMIFFLFTLSIFAQQERTFSGLLIPSLVDQEIDAWHKVPVGQVPSISQVDFVTRHQMFHLVILFSHFAIDKNGSTNISFDMQLISPDKNVHSVRKNLLGYKEKVANKNILLMSRSLIKMAFKEKDPVGEYTIKIHARDHVAKKDCVLTKKVTLREWELGNEPKDVKEYESFMFKYYDSPSPNKAIKAYVEYTSLIDQHQQINAAGIYFFYKIFQNNTYLADHLYRLAKKSNKQVKIKAAFILQLMGKKKEAASLLEEKDKTLLKLFVLPDPYEEITPTGLDMLWCDFFATGRIEPIKKLVEALKYADYAGSIEKFSVSKKTEEDRMNAIKEATFRAANWSLTSNCQQHTLVRNYCLYIIQNEKLPGLTRIYLGLIMQKFFPNLVKVNIPKGGGEATVEIFDK